MRPWQLLSCWDSQGASRGTGNWLGAGHSLRLAAPTALRQFMLSHIVTLAGPSTAASTARAGPPPAGGSHGPSHGVLGLLPIFATLHLALPTQRPGSGGETPTLTRSVGSKGHWDAPAWGSCFCKLPW